MNNAVLSCRICEETHPLAPVSHCAACSGPLDVRYISNGNGSLLTDLQELSSDRALLPHRETAIPNRTPLVPAPRVSAALVPQQREHLIDGSLLLIRPAGHLSDRGTRGRASP